MSFKTRLENWASSFDSSKNLFSSLWLLEDCLGLINLGGYSFSDQELSIMRDIHTYSMRFLLGIGKGTWTDQEDGTASYDLELSDLIHKFKFRCLSFNPINYELNLHKKDSLNLKISDDFSNKYGLSKTLDENSLSYEVYQQYTRISDIQNYYNTSSEVAFYLFKKVNREKENPILNFTFVPPEDLLSCYFFCPQIGETEEDHEKLLHSLFSELEEKLIGELDSINTILSSKKNNERRKFKPSEKLVLTNNNASSIVFGKTREKMIPEARKTPYYSTTYTPDRLIEEKAQIIADWAKETVFKADKKVLGHLAVMKTISKEEQIELVKPLTTSPVGDFDWYVWSSIHSNLKNLLNEKVEMRALRNSFSVSERQYGVTKYSEAFDTSAGLLSHTWILYKYIDGKKEVTVAEPLLSCKIIKEKDQETGAEKEYFILSSMSMFYERAEQSNQVISFHEDLFKIEYEEDGEKKKLAQTKNTVRLVNYLLEHISKFKYFQEHKNKRSKESEEPKKREDNFNKISFETLFKLTNADTRKKRHDIVERVKHCLDYWKSLDYIDYGIRMKKEGAGGTQYDYIILFNPIKKTLLYPKK